ncbi:Adenylate cyclase [hydrothermal vent metagenome]|uniref:Adenylate cyclase n=1 Tax=hydrothermal vent metagenome TaxID=652676 RepID=A0A3B1C9Z5_9ZZZZ
MSNLNLQTAEQQNCYIISDGLIVDELLALLKQKFVCSLEPDEKFRIAYYDTFDWRLYQNDETLALYQYGQKQKLALGKFSDGQVKAVVPLSISTKIPSKLDAIPPALRDLIVSNIAMRALLPVVKIEGDTQKLLLRNKHDKIVARLSLEKNSTVSAEHGRKKSFPERLIVNPVKGYQEELKRVRAILNKIPSLTHCKLNLLDMALAEIGRHTGDYSSKIKIKFNSDIQSVQAVKSILKHLLSAMDMNEPGMLARLDSEFLHDYRIAVRRTRSILSQMKNVFPKDRFEYFKKEFAWLGAVTTPARDLDVYLLEFEKLQNRFVADMRDALLPFRDFLQEQQDYAYKELIAAITSARYKKLKQELNKFFKDDEELVNAPDAKKDIYLHADERIWRSYKRVKKEADRLMPDSPTQDFHELRKSCKKLRYLLEFFQCFYPENKMRKLIKQLKILQDNLGEFQDMDVQHIALRNFAKMMAEQQGVNNADTYMAMGVLADGMVQRKIELQYAFVDCYKKFSRERYQKLFSQLFKPKMKPEQEALHESIG